MTPFQTRQITLMRQMESRLAKDPTTAEIVSMQSDYSNDNKLGLTTISFLPQTLQETIYNDIINRLAVIDPDQYYFPKTSLHLTIHNIRVVRDPAGFTAADIPKAQALLRTLIPTYSAPTFELQGLLTMPTSVSIIALINPKYDHMVKSIRAQFANANIADDKKYFTNEIVFANVTICRFTKSPTKLFLETVQKNKDKLFGKFSAHEVTLVTANAGMHPSKTTIIETFPFANI